MKTKSPHGLQKDENPSVSTEMSASEKAAKDSGTTSSPLHPRRILVPIDFSECSTHALDYALALSTQFQSKLILLHVVEPAVLPENYMSISTILDETNQNLVEAGKERLDTLCRKQVGSRVPVETLVRIGHAYSEISDTAKAMGVDLIVIATHGYKGLKHVLLGSTTERVVRHAACPVLVVR